MSLGNQTTNTWLFSLFVEFIQYYQSQPEPIEPVAKSPYGKPFGEMSRMFTNPQQPQHQPPSLLNMSTPESQHNESFMTNLLAQVSVIVILTLSLCFIYYI